MRSTRWARNRISAVLSLALGGLTAVTPVASKSGLPDVSVFAGAKEVPDDVLGEMRGRFISRNEIVQFGVEMVTQWQTASGEFLSATANLAVNMGQNVAPSVSFVPHLAIETTNGDDPLPGTAGSPATRVAGSGNGALHVAGVAQTIQVAGDLNRVVQDTNIIVSAEPLPGPSQGGLSGPGTQSVTSGSGASVSATLAPNGMSVEARVPSQGEAIQKIRGTARTGQSATGLIQSTRLTSDLQRIHNTINVRIQVTPEALVRSADPRASMHSLRGIRPMGVF